MGFFIALSEYDHNSFGGEYTLCQAMQYSKLRRLRSRSSPRSSRTPFQAFSLTTRVSPLRRIPSSEKSSVRLASTTS